MAIGGNRFNGFTQALATITGHHGVKLQVKRYVQSQMTNKNIFGTPTGYTPQSLTVDALVIEQDIEDDETVAGGKPKGEMVFFCQPQVLLEHDEVTYGGGFYSIEEIHNASLGGTDRLEMAIGKRVVKKP